MIPEKCEMCGDRIIKPLGSPEAPLYIFGPYPGKDELHKGIPWCGPAGEVLKKELLRAGVHQNYYRLSNVWLHGKKNDKEDLGQHVDWLLADMKQAKVVLMMGGLPANLFMNSNITDITGLVVEPPMFPKSIDTVVAVYNPAKVIVGEAATRTVGEVRHGIQVFARYAKEYCR